MESFNKSSQKLIVRYIARNAFTIKQQPGMEETLQNFVYRMSRDASYLKIAKPEYIVILDEEKQKIT